MEPLLSSGVPHAFFTLGCDEVTGGRGNSTRCEVGDGSFRFDLLLASLELQAFMSEIPRLNLIWIQAAPNLHDDENFQRGLCR